jgi:hypothetical protein
MKLKFAGLILIAVGFAAPFVLQKISPTFMYSSVVSTLCFWIGFLAILSPFENRTDLNPYCKWARYAILFNIVWTLLFSGYIQLMLYHESLQVIGYYTLRFFSFIQNPIAIIFEVIVPKPMVQLSDGTVQVTHSFLGCCLQPFLV